MDWVDFSDEEDRSPSTGSEGGGLAVCPWGPLGPQSPQVLHDEPGGVGARALAEGKRGWKPLLLCFLTWGA